MTNVNKDQGRQSFTLNLTPGNTYTITGNFSPPLEGISAFRVLSNIDVNLTCTFARTSFIYDGSTNQLSRTNIVSTRKDTWYDSLDTSISQYTVSLDSSTALINGEVVNLYFECK